MGLAVDFASQMRIALANDNLDKPNEVLVLKELPMRTTNALLEDITSVWIELHHRQPWSVTILDKTNFLEGTWATSADTFTRKRFGLSLNAYLAGRQDQIKNALNTLAIIEWKNTTNLEAARALQAVADRTILVVPESHARMIVWPARHITPES